MDEMSEPLPLVRVPPTFLSQSRPAEGKEEKQQVEKHVGVVIDSGERRSGPSLLNTKALKGTPPQQRDLMFRCHVQLCCEASAVYCYTCRGEPPLRAPLLRGER